MEINKIYLGDAYELIKQVPDKSVDLIITDPPYEFGTGGVGTGIFKDRKTLKDTYDQIRSTNLDKGIDAQKILPELVRVMKYINIYIWCNKEQILTYLDYFVNELNCNFEFIIWGKINPPPFTGAHYLKDKEYCLYFWEKSKVKIKGTYDTLHTVYLTPINTYDKEKYGHPTIKPIDIISNLVLNSSQETQLVLDPFSGSGTTCLAAKQLNRQYLGFELNPDYHKISQGRLLGLDQHGRLDLLQFNQDQSDPTYTQPSLLDEM